MSLFFPLAGCSAVLAEETQGAYAATQHLLDLGHRHLLWLYRAGPAGAPPICAGRRDGICRALRDSVLPPAEHLLEFAVPMEWLDAPGSVGSPTPAGQDAASEASLTGFFRDNDRFTGILAQNDHVAIRVNALLARLGLRVPRDYSLIGFDDTEPILDECGHNILTTVRLPLREAGRAAGDLVLRQLDAATARPETVTLPVALVVRGTTARRQG